MMYQSQGQIKDLRDHGYEVWMDDFGSGFSSLSLLKDLDVDLVKFDLRFLVGSAISTGETSSSGPHCHGQAAGDEDSCRRG